MAMASLLRFSNTASTSHCCFYAVLTPDLKNTMVCRKVPVLFKQRGSRLPYPTEPVILWAFPLPVIPYVNKRPLLPRMRSSIDGLATTMKSSFWAVGVSNTCLLKWVLSLLIDCIPVESLMLRSMGLHSLHGCIVDDFNTTFLIRKIQWVHPPAYPQIKGLFDRHLIS